MPLHDLVLASTSLLLRDSGQEIPILLHLLSGVQMSTAARKIQVFTESANSTPCFVEMENVEDPKFDLKRM